jgi:hypothetical protein
LHGLDTGSVRARAKTAGVSNMLTNPTLALP